MENKKSLSLELRGELLKERIYATLALLAVLLTLDPSHTSASKAALTVVGTLLSLWAASFVASRMSHRIITQEHSTEQQSKELLRHSPILLSGVFPLFAITLSIIKVISLGVALNIAIGSSLVLLFGWSFYSARAFKASRLATLLLASLQLAIGLAIVVLNMALGH